jgi:hypothetical protein
METRRSAAGPTRGTFPGSVHPGEPDTALHYQAARNTNSSTPFWKGASVTSIPEIIHYSWNDHKTITPDENKNGNVQAPGPANSRFPVQIPGRFYPQTHSNCPPGWQPGSHSLLRALSKAYPLPSGRQGVGEWMPSRLSHPGPQPHRFR